MKTGIVLIGFMGAGKSTIGRALARRLHLPLIDTDRFIERKTQRTIPQIFAQDGEDAFRAMEQLALQELAERKPAVIATGGGMVMRDENWPLLRRLGTIVYLRGDPDALFERVSRHPTRPLLQTPNPRETFDRLLAQRTPIYTRADLTVDTTGMESPAVAERILKLMRERSGA